MATTGIYLNFSDTTEEAFELYRSIFGGDFVGGIHRFSEVPKEPGAPELSEKDKNLVMHISLPILGGVMLMGTDAPESMGLTLHKGNNVHISLHPDSRKEADRIFVGLSAGGEVDVPMTEMFWGDYYGSFRDRYGVQWMINTDAE